MTDRERILIVEPQLGGHRGPYLLWISKGFARAGAKVHIVTQSGNLDHPCLTSLREACESGRIEISGAPDTSFSSRRGPFRLLAREWFQWRMLQRWYLDSVENFRPTLVFVPVIDECLYATALLGSPFRDCQWSGLTMRPSFHFKAMGISAPVRKSDGVKAFLFKRLLRIPSLRRLFSLDAQLVDYSRYFCARGDVVKFLPQPAHFARMPTPDAARIHLGIPADQPLILLYGAISARKGIYPLLEAMRLPNFPSHVGVVLAGKVDADVASQLGSPAVRSLIEDGRLHVLDRFISEEEERLIFAASSIVWLGYTGHYTASGVLTQAAAAGRPILGCKDGLIGRQVITYKLGHVVDVEDPDQIIQAIRSLIVDSNPTAALGNPPWLPAVGTEVAQDILARELLES